MDSQMKIVGATDNTEGWKEIPEFSLEMVRDRSIKYKTLLAGSYATTDQMRLDAAAFLHKLLDGSPVEQFVVLFLNLKNQVTGASKVASGDLHQVHIDVKNIFRAAVVAGADRIVIAHNHPNSNATASANDIMMTAHCIEVGQFLGIEVVDHIVVSPDGSHYSLWENRERFEEEMTKILKDGMKGADALGALIQKIVENLPSPDQSGSIGNMRMDEVRKGATAKALGEGNPLAAVFAKFGMGPKPGSGSTNGGNNGTSN